MEELRYENVDLEHLRDILSLHIPQNVDEPFEVLVRRANPKKVDLLAGDSGVTDEWGWLGNGKKEMRSRVRKEIEFEKFAT